MGEHTERTIEIDELPVTFAIRLESTGACMRASLVASGAEWAGTVLDGLTPHASVEDFSDAELEEVYRTARHMRADLEE